MPQKRQPRSLLSQCHARVAADVLETCRLLQSIAQETSTTQAFNFTRNCVRPAWISSLPGAIRSKILHDATSLISSTFTETTSVGAGPIPLYLLALLLSPDIKHLKVDLCCYYGCSHQSALLKLLASEGRGLESLELARSALLRLDRNLLHTALVSAPNLKCLRLRNIATDGILEVIGVACPNLTVLDVSHSRQVTNAGIRQLLFQVEFKDKQRKQSAVSIAGSLLKKKLSGWSRIKHMARSLQERLLSKGKRDRKDLSPLLLEYCEKRTPICRSLRVLNIANTGVSGEGIILALNNVPSLESLGEYCHIGRAMEIIDDNHIDNLRFDLKTVRCSRTNLRRLQLISKLCPNLEKITINEPNHSPSALYLLPFTITSLALQNIPIQASWMSGLYEFLNTQGRQYSSLTLRFYPGEYLASLDLSKIFQSCPNLRMLIVDGADISWSERSKVHMSSLSKVQLGKIVPGDTLLRIVESAPRLHTLHAHTVPHLSAKLFTALTSLSNQIECFYIYEMTNDLSDANILQLLKTWRTLKQLGHLGNWNLTPAQQSVVQNYLKGDNFHIQLNAGSHWFCSKCFPLP